MNKFIKNFVISLVVCLSFFLLCNQAGAVDFLCLHYKNDPLTPETCQFLADKFGFTSKLYKNYTGKRHSIIWLAGFGTPDGFWMDPEGKNKASWGTLAAKYKADVLVVDACYSGRVFDYNIPKGITVITSTNKCSVSINTVEKWTDGKYIPTLASIIYCFYSKDPACKKYVGCTANSFDPQVCQMSIILHSCADWNYRNNILKDIQTHPEYHPIFSIGTAMINGQPWR